MNDPLSSPEALLAGLAVDPGVFLHNLDFVNHRALLIGLNESQYRQAVFLDDRVLTPRTQGAWFALDTVVGRLAQVSGSRPPHFIFHLGHCGSTLISRLLGELSSCFAIREPLSLLSLAYAWRELDSPLSRLSGRRWQQLSDVVIKLLGRTYRPVDRPVVKATSTCANLIEPVLESNSESRAVLLYVDLKTYLATMLRSEATRESARANAPAWLGDLHTLTASIDVRLHQLPDAQQVAVAWLGAMAFFTRAAEIYTSQVQLTDFDEFTIQPTEDIEKMANFLGLHVVKSEIQRLVQSRLMRTYAKIPEQPFDAQSRKRELQTARQRFAVEIDAAVEWTLALIDSSAMLRGVKPYVSRVSSSSRLER